MTSQSTPQEALRKGLLHPGAASPFQAGRRGGKVNTIGVRGLLSFFVLEGTLSSDFILHLDGVGTRTACHGRLTAVCLRRQVFAAGRLATRDKIRVL